MVWKAEPSEGRQLDNVDFDLSQNSCLKRTSGGTSYEWMGGASDHEVGEGWEMDNVD